MNCLVCGGTGIRLGSMGWVVYYRCQDCGIEYRTEPSETPSIFDDPGDET